VQPEVEAVLDVADERVGRQRAGAEEQPADDEPAGTLGGDVEHHQEEAEEEERGAQVVLQHQDHHRDAEHRQDRAEVAAARQVDEHDPAAGQREGVTVQDQVARERDHQQHLGDLAGLEAEARDVDPDPRTVDLSPDDRQEGKDQQQDADQARGVGEALQDAVVAQQEQRGDEEDDTECHPGQLLAGEGVRLSERLVGQVQAAEDGQAEPVDRRDERQQDGVGVGRDDADGDVGGHDQSGQPAAVAGEVGGHDALDAEADGGVGADPHREGEDEQEQLRAPASPVHEAHQGPGLTHRRVPVTPGRRPGSRRSCPRSGVPRPGRRRRCPRAPSRRRRR
jgi:hypothetical protein